MAYSITRETPIKGLSFTYITDAKYRVDSVLVRFVLPLEADSPQIYQMLGMLMVDSTGVHREKSAMSEKLKSLYGAEQRYSFARLGDRAVLSFVVRCIGDRFTINGEVVTTEAAQLLLDMVFSPNVTDGAFNEKYFEMARRELIEGIKSLPNNRHSYAVRRAREVAFEGEPAGYPPLGTLESAEKLTASGMYENYRKMLSVAGISVIFCGSGNNTEAQKLVKERFTEFAAKRLESAPDIIIDDDTLVAPSPLRPEPITVRESIEQEQLKLVMCFKISGEDIYAEKIACSLFGGSDFSKLFTVVREKMSLCYYCQSYIMEFKNVMIVDSGIDTANEQRAREEILHQLELLQAGDFTDEEMENTKKKLSSTLRIVPDSAEELCSLYSIRIARGMDILPEQEVELLGEVTRERVIAAAKGFRLDTVYVLEPEKEDGGEQ